MLIDNRWRAGAGRGMRHCELGTGARRPVLDGRDILDDAATEVAVNLGHKATPPFGRGERAIPFTPEARMRNFPSQGEAAAEG